MLEKTVKNILSLIGTLALGFSVQVFNVEAYSKGANHADYVISCNQGVERPQEAIGEGDGYSALLHPEKWKRETKRGSKIIWVPRRGSRRGHWKEVPYRYTETVHYPAGKLVLELEDLIIDEPGNDLYVNAHGRYEVWVKGQGLSKWEYVDTVSGPREFDLPKNVKRVKIINAGRFPVHVDSIGET